MRQSLRTLLSGVIDYAGLFPPAQLDMATSVANFVNYASGPDAWVMTRFLCTAPRLAELRSEIERIKPMFTIPVTVVGRPSSDRPTWEDAREQDARDMTSFADACSGSAEVQGYEVRIPSNAMIDSCVRDLGGFDNADVFVELPWDDGMNNAIASLSDSEWLNAKARTGGTTRDAFPSADGVAGFLHNCVSAELPFKLTAGLHHPFPTDDSLTGARTHGFLNVLVASTLIYSEDLPRSAVARLLADADPTAFTFDVDTVSWRGESANLAAIRDARGLFVGFGSCSIDEPLTDLMHAGLLP